MTREAGCSRKVCQLQTAQQGKTKDGQGGPGSTRCPRPPPPPPTPLQLHPCHHLTTCQLSSTTEMRGKWEGRMQKLCQREVEDTQNSRWPNSWRCSKGGRKGARENMVTLPVIRGKQQSWLTWIINTTTHYCFINPLFSALCAKPVPSLSVFLFSLSITLPLSLFPLVLTRINPSVTPSLTVFSNQMSTRLRSNQKAPKDRIQLTVLPGRPFWGRGFTLTITKLQSELTRATNSIF